MKATFIFAPFIWCMLMLGCTETPDTEKPDTEKPDTAHVIHFREDKPTGWVRLLAPGTRWEGYVEKVEFPDAEQDIRAQGDVTIPPGKQVLLMFPGAVAGDEEGPIDLAPLDQFEPDELLILGIPFSLIPPDEIAHLERHKSLRYLSLGPLSSVSNETLGRVGELVWLEGLEIPETDITDAGLRHLRSMRNLEKLNLHGTDITGKGLQHLATLEQLRILDLHRTDITDAAMRYVKQIESLETLDLQDTQVGDAGMMQLTALPNLKTLYIDATQVTQEGIAKFQKARPDVKLDFGLPEDVPSDLEEP